MTRDTFTNFMHRPKKKKSERGGGKGCYNTEKARRRCGRDVSEDFVPFL